LREAKGVGEKNSTVCYSIGYQSAEQNNRQSRLNVEDKDLALIWLSW
jgi:hypothetical protein